MEMANYLRENTNIGFNPIKLDKTGLKNNLLKESNRNVNNISNIKSVTNQAKEDKKSFSLNLKFPQVTPVEDISERDVSMLSINDESHSCQYYLPLSSDLANENVANKFANDVFTRRNNVRNLTEDKLSEYGQNILSLSYDNDTGDIMVIEILDYMQELECLQLPLGMNFLEGTPINVRQRTSAVNWLYKITDQLDTERYSVPHAMAIVDRYVKIKGEAFDPKTYKAVLATSWYIACKWDLLEYPPISDVCTLTKLNIVVFHQLENEILNTINFYLGMPTPIVFLRPLAIIRQREGISHTIAKCLVEVCVCNYELAGHPAHIQASAAYCLAMAMSLHETLDITWNSLIQFVTGLDIEDIRPVVATLARVLYLTDFKIKMPFIYSIYKKIFEVFSKRKEELKLLANL